MNLFNLLRRHGDEIIYSYKNMTNYYKKSTLVIFLVIGVIYLCICFTSIIVLANLVTNKYIHIMGKNLTDMAYIVSQSLQIHDSDVKELKALTYDKVPEHPVNKQLANLFMKDKVRDRDLSYAYVTVQLSSDEIKYYVTEEDEGAYSYPVGTPLNVMYLLDVVLDEIVFRTESGFHNYYYTDKNRYDVITPREKEAMQNKLSKYFINDDIWGKYVSSMVPLYSVEGNYIGIVGIDSSFSKFMSYRNILAIMFVVVFIVPIIFSIFIYYLFYKGYITSLQRMSITDPLTGLYNREFYHINYERMIASCYRYKQSLALIMLDLDLFKSYNDSYGHQAGDECLKQIATAIKSQLHRPLDMLIRYGGEEFLALMPNTDYNGAINIANGIQNAVRALKITHKASSVSDYVTISQGIYIVNSGDVIENAYKYVERADEALYQSKSSGRDRFTVYGAS